MSRLLIFISVLFIQQEVKAQLFGKKDFSIQQGIMSFHPAVLNNESNLNNQLSWVSEIDRHFNLNRISSINYGLGLGDFRNPDTMFRPYEHGKFMRLKIGLVIHLPQYHTARNWSPKRINPYFKAAYNLDIADYNYGQKNGSRLIPSLRLGAGMIYRLNHYLGIVYEFSHNQRVNPDYRSFFQQNLGIILNFDLPYQPY